jgi:hypothetical protein
VAVEGPHRPRANPIRSAIARSSIFNVVHVEAVSKVDFIVRKDAEYRIPEFERRRIVEVDGHPIWIASAEDLVLSKLAWAKDTVGRSFNCAT